MLWFIMRRPRMWIRANKKRRTSPDRALTGPDGSSWFCCTADICWSVCLSRSGHSSYCVNIYCKQICLFAQTTTELTDEDEGWRFICVNPFMICPETLKKWNNQLLMGATLKVSTFNIQTERFLYNCGLCKTESKEIWNLNAIKLLTAWRLLTESKIYN